MINVNINALSFDIGMLKILFVGLCVYYTNLKIENLKINVNYKNILCVIGIILISILTSIVKNKVSSNLSFISYFFLLCLLYTIIINNNFVYTILITVMSQSINYIFLFVGLIFTYGINICFEIKNDYMNLIFLILIQIILLYFFYKIKKIKNGISYLRKKSLQNDYLNVIMLNICIIIYFSIMIIVNEKNISSLVKSFSFSFIIFGTSMFLTIQKSIQLYYKQKLLIQDLNETKKELEDKKKEIRILEEENLNFSKNSHSLAHKQKVLEYKINKLLFKTESGEELDLKDKVKEISRELYKEVESSCINKTGITNIDDMLETMQEECKKNNIEFNLQICGNIFKMINNFVEKEDLEILLADHIKDAIIAINHSDNINRSILVKLGKIDKCYGVYFYDSGVEFDKEVLDNLGKRPVTTYADEGGTGMGFMNTFDTLKKYSASLIIKHLGKPSKENFTKIIMIKFDKNANFCLTK